MALSVTDEEIMDAFRQWAKVEGMFAAPEGAASLAAYRKLRERGFFEADDSVVLFNTGSGLKYRRDRRAERARAAAARRACDRRDHRTVLETQSLAVGR